MVETSSETTVARIYKATNSVADDLGAQLGLSRSEVFARALLLFNDTVQLLAMPPLWEETPEVRLAIDERMAPRLFVRTPTINQEYQTNA